MSIFIGLGEGISEEARSYGAQSRGITPMARKRLGYDGQEQIFMQGVLGEA